MQLKIFVLIAFLTSWLLAGGCAPRPALVVRDKDAATRVKSIAIMPFFDAQMLSAIDPLYDGFGSSFIPAKMFDARAERKLGKRFELIGQVRSLEALKKVGVEYRHTAGAWSAVRDPESIRWGFTLDDAVAAGKELNADSILLCGQGQLLDKNKKPIQVVVVRLVSTASGKTLWGVNSSGQPGLFSKSKVVDDLLGRIAKEAP